MTGALSDVDVIATGTWADATAWEIYARTVDGRLYTFLKVISTTTGRGLFFGGFGGAPLHPHRVINHYLGVEAGYRAVLARTPPHVHLALFDERGALAELSTETVQIGELTLQLAAARLPATSASYELVATDNDGRRIDAAWLSI